MGQSRWVCKMCVNEDDRGVPLDCLDLRPEAVFRVCPDFVEREKGQSLV
jgi:hypothetical protein